MQSRAERQWVSVVTPRSKVMTGAVVRLLPCLPQDERPTRRWSLNKCGSGSAQDRWGTVASERYVVGSVFKREAATRSVISWQPPTTLGRSNSLPSAQSHPYLSCSLQWVSMARVKEPRPSVHITDNLCCGLHVSLAETLAELHCSLRSFFCNLSFPLLFSQVSDLHCDLRFSLHTVSSPLLFLSMNLCTSHSIFVPASRKTQTDTI